MKKFYSVANVLLLLTTVVSCVCYDSFGGLWLKALSASWFVWLGVVNFHFAWREKKLGRGFPMLLVLGLAVCMTADVVLGFDFIVGALIFAAGHVLYFLAYCRLEKLEPRDFVPICVVLVGTVILLGLPIFDFGSELMHVICYIYAAIISCMVGKSIANYRRTPDRTNLLLLVGSCMFYFSDLMLVLCWFAGAPRITDSLCLFTYFPGQAVLAHAMYWHVKQ